MELKPKDIWIEEIEKSSGEEVMMNTPACVIYKTDNHNCRGCSYELNCAKLSSVMMLQIQLANYKPKDFLDYVKAGQTTAEMVENIINAKTPEAIEKIIKGEKE